MQVSKWGNSLAIRLPASVVDALDLQAGDDIQIQIADSRVFTLKKKPGRNELLARLHKFRGRLPDDFILDREDTHGRG